MEEEGGEGGNGEVEEGEVGPGGESATRRGHSRGPVAQGRGEEADESSGVQQEGPGNMWV